jgi:hypothetical protein
MTIDVKIRVALFLVSAGISVLAAVAAAHGLAGPLDGIGGTTPP